MFTCNQTDMILSARRKRSSKDISSDKMVYISNIPYDIRWMELKDIIREKAGDVSYVEMIEKGDGKSKGCALVEFKDRETAKKCVENMHRMTVKDRSIVVKEIRVLVTDPERFFKRVKEETGVDFFANQSGQKNFPIEEPPKEIFETFGLSPVFLRGLGIHSALSNRLPITVGPSKLKEVFSLAGKVLDVDFPLDKTGKTKCVACIEFEHPLEAVQAISMLDSQKLYDKMLCVRMDNAVTRKRRESRMPGELPYGLQSVGQGLGLNGVPLVNIILYECKNGFLAANAASFNNQSLLGSNPLMNQGFQPPQSMNPPFGPNRPPAGPMPGGNGIGVGIPMGRSFDGPPTIPMAPGAFDQGPMMGASHPFDKADMPPLGMGGGAGGMNVGFGAPAAINGNYRSFPSLLSNAPDFEYMQSGGGPGQPGGFPNRPNSRTIIVRNLPLDFTWQSLRDRMRCYGEVEFADIIQPGVGKIRFKSTFDADKAYDVVVVVVVVVAIVFFCLIITPVLFTYSYSCNRGRSAALQALKLRIIHSGLIDFLTFFINDVHPSKLSYALDCCQLNLIILSVLRLRFAERFGCRRSSYRRRFQYRLINFASPVKKNILLNRPLFPFKSCILHLLISAKFTACSSRCAGCSRSILLCVATAEQWYIFYGACCDKQKTGFCSDDSELLRLMFSWYLQTFILTVSLIKQKQAFSI
ncbi:putative RNA recognition [Trichinella spiralis]|uniref:putative RNA recognition n=1 Tax=Trichinella spiralis TaxID=6334 RepID=UPI0001EFE6FC|nr:putative RNA recognition [Trichinella spiralis]